MKTVMNFSVSLFWEFIHKLWYYYHFKDQDWESYVLYLQPTKVIHIIPCIEKVSRTYKTTLN